MIATIQLLPATGTQAGGIISADGNAASRMSESVGRPARKLPHGSNPLFRIRYCWKAAGRYYRASTVASGSDARLALKRFLALNPHVVSAHVQGGAL